ncbi:tetratricopeptide repeat protein [bacterium]|nr:tetratricopeptide repeat protein [bacterium]
MPRRSLGLFIGLTLLAHGTALPESVLLKDGRRLEGLIISKDDKGIVLDMGTMESRWSLAEIESIEPGLPVNVFRQRINRALSTAEQQARGGKPELATRTLQNAIAQFQDDLDRMDAVPEEVQKLLDRVEKMRRDLVPKSPESQKAEQLFEAAQNDLNFAREVDAFKKLKEAATYDPKRADIQNMLGRVAVRVNEPEAAIEALGAAIRLSPEAYYTKACGPLLNLLEDRGRRLLTDRRAADALPVFEEILLLKGNAGGAVSLDEFLARQITREKTPPEEVLIEVYKYADDNDLVDLALAAVRKAATIKPDDPAIGKLLNEENFVDKFRRAISDGNLELAAKLQSDPMAQVAHVAERMQEAAGKASPDIQAAGLLESAKAALAAKNYAEAERLGTRVVSDFPGSSSSSAAAEIVRVARLEAPIRAAIEKARLQIEARKYDAAEEALEKLAADYAIAESTQKGDYDTLVKRIPREREADRLWELASIEIQRERFEEALERLNELVGSYPETVSGQKAAKWLGDYRKRLEGEATRARLFDVGATFAIADPALWRAADDSRPARRDQVAPVVTEKRSAAWEQFDQQMAAQAELLKDRRARWLHMGLPLLIGCLGVLALVWRFARPGAAPYKEVDQLDEEKKEASESSGEVGTSAQHTCRMCGHKNAVEVLICGICESPMQLTAVEQERAEDRDRRANFDPWEVRVQAKAINDFEKYYQKARDLAETSDVQAAIENCRHALHEDPLRKDGYLLLASLYERTGKNDEAATCYREVLLIDPGEVIVRQKIESLLSLSQQPLRFSPVGAALAGLVWWALFWIVIGIDSAGWYLRLPLCVIGAVLTWKLWQLQERSSKITVPAAQGVTVERPRALPTEVLSWRGQDRQAAELAKEISAHTGTPVPTLSSRRLLMAIALSLVALLALVALAWGGHAPLALVAWPALAGLAFYLLEIHPRAYTAHVLLRHAYEETTSPWVDPHRPFKPNRRQVLGEFLVTSFNEFPIRWALRPHPYGDHRQGVLNSLQQTLNRHWACHQFYNGLHVVRDIEMPKPPGIAHAASAFSVVLLLAVVGTAYHLTSKSAREERFEDSMRLGYQNLLDGQPLVARGYFLEASIASPRNAVAALYSGHALNALERPAEAERAFRVAVSLSPNEPVPHNDYGNFLQRRGRLREATTQYELALRSEPQNADILSNLGSAFYKLKEYDEAAKTLAKAVEADPNHSRAHTSLGLALEALGKWSEAEAAFRNAVRVAPDVDYTNVARTRLEEGPRTSDQRLELPASNAP